MKPIKHFLAQSKLVLVAAGCLMLAGCYEYKTPPIADASMKLISETKLGARVLALSGKMASDENISKAQKGMTKDTMVFEVSEDFLLYQEKKEKGENWEVHVLMASSDHMMFCQYLANDTVKPVEGLVMEKKKDGPSTSYTISGDQAKLQEHVIMLAKKSPKVCLSVPFAAFE